MSLIPRLNSACRKPFLSAVYQHPSAKRLWMGAYALYADVDKRYVCFAHEGAGKTLRGGKVPGHP
jgi:hypothetical protein